MNIRINKTHEITNRFQGSEKKKTVIYEGKKYLAKFPDPVRQQKISMQYINNIYSEYVGCHIFQSVGIKTQNTLLADFELPTGENRTVCLCEDFTNQRYLLQALQSKLLSLIEIEKPATTELRDILYALRTYPHWEKIEEQFWDMFVVDALIGNPDRHNENWGILEDSLTGEVEFAPVFDCGSSLCAMVSDEKLKKALGDTGEFHQYLFNSYSAIRINGKRIQYADFLKKGEYVECNRALKRIVPKMDIKKIAEIIKSANGISPVRSQFLQKLLVERYEKILLPTYQRVCKKEKEIGKIELEKKKRSKQIVGPKR